MTRCANPQFEPATGRSTHLLLTRSALKSAQKHCDHLTYLWDARTIYLDESSCTN